jgi:hypothetical protein
MDADTLGTAAVAIDALTRWAAGRPDIHALALVGSRAGGTPRPDSDVDLVLLTEDVERYVLRDDWAAGLGPIVATRRWGAVTERRIRLPDGIEMDVAIAPPKWAATKRVDRGTRRVVRDGMRILHDPRGALATLQQAVGVKS